MKDKATVEFTAKQAQIITKLLPAAPLPPGLDLSAATIIMKTKLEVDEIVEQIKKAFEENPPPPAPDENNLLSKSKRRKRRYAVPESAR